MTTIDPTTSNKDMPGSSQSNINLQLPQLSPNSGHDFRCSVLIADDDPVSGSILMNICKDMGATCVQSFSGDEAVDQLAQNDFDFAVLDLHMPGLDGLQVLQNIRQTSCEVELPVIIVTSDSDRESALAAFEYGANDYITKPFDSATVSARIRTHLRMQDMQRKLSESNLRYELAMQGTNDGLWDWDLNTRQIYYSPRWQSMVGFDEQEYYGAPEHWFQKIHGDDQVQVFESLHIHLSGNTSHFEVELRMQHTSQEYLWMLCRGKATFDEQGNPVRMAGSLTDVTKAKSVDAVTGLPNRTLILQRVKRRFEKFKRDAKRPFAVLYIDLDDFKIINDTYGHAAGDLTLASVSSRIEDNLRLGEAILARIGGDEFAVLFEDLESSEHANIVLKRLVNAIGQPLDLEDNVVIYPAASLGLAFSHDGMQSFQDILSAADSAMYEAKHLGKNQYCIR